MQTADLVGLCLGALREHRLRTGLSMLGIAIGVAAVILLTSIGEGARTYIVKEFTQFGTNIIKISPGKTETVGLPGVLGGTTRKLTIDDGEELYRVAGVLEVCPVALGQARVEANGKGRSINIYGVTPNMPRVWKIDIRQGSFWPAGDPRRGAQMAVLGPRVKRELFGEANPIGEFIRAAGTRLRVVGVLEPKGQVLGFDMDDIVYVPVATGMQMFNLDEVLEIDVTFAHESLGDEIVERIREVLIQRHDGHEDFTITTQAGMLEVFGKIMNVVTLAVSAIAGISLLVGAIGILTMMWISVGERTHEIGVVRAIGATSRQVQSLFLAEAIVLAMLGGLLGLVLAASIVGLLSLLVPGLPIQTPVEYAVAAIAVSAFAGLISGVAPARRAAEMDPIVALRAE